MEVDDDEWIDALDELQSAVEHHLGDEEDELFPVVRKHLSGEQSAELGRQYARAHERHMSRLEGDRYEEMTREELYELAQDLDIPGRSHMSKDELIRQIRSQ